MRGPAFEFLGRGGDEDNLWVRRFLPLYRKLGPVMGRARQRLVQEALARAAEPEEWLPAELTRDVPGTLAALRLLHQPPDDSDPAGLEAHATPAHRRLASEELFAFALGVALRRAGRLARPGQAVPTTPELRERLKDYLPFRLTGAQRKAFREIVADLTSGPGHAPPAPGRRGQRQDPGGLPGHGHGGRDRRPGGAAGAHRSPGPAARRHRPAAAEGRARRHASCCWGP